LLINPKEAEKQHFTDIGIKKWREKQLEMERAAREKEQARNEHIRQLMQTLEKQAKQTRDNYEEIKQNERLALQQSIGQVEMLDQMEKQIK
jgi:hypothetical protein